jgi:rubrerythrin
MRSVLDDAIALEERARTAYREARERVSDPGAKRILELLAAEEEKHAAALASLREGMSGTVPDSSLLADVKGLVEGAIRSGQVVVSKDASLRDVLSVAMETERATERFYSERARRTSDVGVQELFHALAEREEGHYLLVSSLLEYFDRPKEWVESAEFGLRPQY